MRRALFAVLVLVVALAAAPGAFAGPPGGLTAGGRLTWQLEALFHDRFGSRPVYLVYRTSNFTPKGASLTTPERGFYARVFAGASGSSFTLVKRASDPLGHPVAVKVAGRYVRCAAKSWLAFAYGTAGLSFQCVRPS